jgi:hypothetical protein
VNSDWSIKYDAAFPTEGATAANAKYCLDRAIAVILKKREHSRAARHSRLDRLVKLPDGYLGADVHAAASLNSPVVHVVSDNFEYSVAEIVNALDSAQQFLRVFGESRETNERGWPTEFASGYLPFQDGS